MQRSRVLCLLFLLFLIPLAHAAKGASTYADLADGPKITVDWSRGTTQFVTLHGNREFVFLNGQKGGKYLLVITQDATGSRIPVWPASVRCPGTTCPTVTTLAGKTDYLTFIDNGTNYDFVGLAQNF
jgi:hypothetical protein